MQSQFFENQFLMKLTLNTEQDLSHSSNLKYYILIQIGKMLRAKTLSKTFRISFFKSDSHYDILGISKTAPQAEVRKAYLKKAKQYHPDKNQSPDALQMFKKLGQAYKTLSDPYLRKAYDMGVTNPSMIDPDMQASIKPNTSQNQSYYNNKWYGFKKPDEHTLRDQYTNIYWEAQQIQKENIKKFMKNGFRFCAIFVICSTLIAAYFESKRLARKKAMQNQIIKGQHKVNTKMIGDIPVRDYIQMRSRQNVAN